MRNVSDMSCKENQNTHFMLNNIFFFENRAVYGMMWRNIVEPDAQQMTIWRMCFACLLPTATNTHSEYITRFAFPLQQWLHEDASRLRSTYFAYFVLFSETSRVAVGPTQPI
jgi:hypothetical protein